MNSKTKFHGSLDELKAAVENTNLDGTWSEKDGKTEFRSKGGAILNWWPKTGTLQFQGNKTESERLEAGVRAALEGGVTVAQPSSGPRIFVVHGHDKTALEQLELVLRRLNLDPFILANSSGGGNTIIEALESEIGKHAAAEFGIVLMTPDDMGYAKKDGEKDVKPRARQNVVLEMGMLLSSLTRKRVAILVKGFIELPSDAGGLLYCGFNEHVKEVVPKLAARLQECGFNLTADQIVKASS